MKKINQDIHNYIVTQINPFIQPLVTELVRKRPANPLSYSINWMMERDKKKGFFRSRKVIESDTEEQCRDQVKQLEVVTVEKKKASRRKLSEQTLGGFNDKAQLQMSQNDNLTQKEKAFLKQFMHRSILFQNLDSKDEEIIMKAMTIKQTEEYEVIVKEGDPGNHFYIIDKGEYDCYKVTNGQNALIKTYKAGDSFGDLSLMYNHPRSASIVANTPGRLFALERSIFSHILKVAALRKQIIIKQAIDKVEILKFIPPDQKYNLIDLLKQEDFSDGQYVIRQGELGDKFYIVLEGKMKAEKQNQLHESSVVWQYGEGDYFGELALINNEPRKASIRSEGISKLAVVSREGFKKMFGGMQQTLKQTIHKYQD